MVADTDDAELLRRLGVPHRYRVLVCGSRVWGEAFDKQQRPRRPAWVAEENAIVARIVARLAELKGEELVLIVGGAKGADTMAESAGRVARAAIERYDADWDHEGKAAGPMRNQRMLDTGVDLCVALYARGEPFNPGMSRGGTNDMVFRCVAARVHVHAWVEGGWRTFDGVRWSPQ